MKTGVVMSDPSVVCGPLALPRGNFVGKSHESDDARI